jgi:peptidyl-dipeptidase A
MTSTSPTDVSPAHLLRSAEEELLDLAIESAGADWVYTTYINDDTQSLAARANARLLAAGVRWAKRALELPVDSLSAEERRKTHLLRVGLPIVGPEDPKRAEELTRTVAGMQGTYAKKRHVPLGGKDAVDLQALSRVLSESRDPAALEDAWVGWHEVGRAIRAPFTRYVELANEGARELGFADLGVMWRSRYDMEPSALAAEVDRLWRQVEPLYRSLHAYVRIRLRAAYGPDHVPERGPIPVHLLGNMWAQSWEGLFGLVAPEDADPGFDLTKVLVARGTSPTEMVRYGERFFVSLGLDPLPATFWERSMLVRPRDREVVCHASAWDLDYVNDLRIKMCIEITGEDFQTIHHELGHNYYQRAYAGQPYLFRESAHDGFHEAIGDTIGLSVTPEYLVRVGLLERAPDPGRDVGLLLQRALEKVAFLPFGLKVDRWRWDVFSGAIGPDDYNRTWWEMTERYQGVRPPRPRDESEFDPGAKYHVPSGVPYLRYFLARILQFQFHRALARTIGFDGPIHRASVYGSKEAGDRLRRLLTMGAQREWPDALEALTGERRMDAQGLLDYFAPLRSWLDRQTRDAPQGW